MTAETYTLTVRSCDTTASAEFELTDQQATQLRVLLAARYGNTGCGCQPTMNITKTSEANQ